MVNDGKDGDPIRFKVSCTYECMVWMDVHDKASNYSARETGWDGDGLGIGDGVSGAIIMGRAYILFILYPGFPLRRILDMVRCIHICIHSSTSLTTTHVVISRRVLLIVKLCMPLSEFALEGWGPLGWGIDRFLGGGGDAVAYVYVCICVCVFRTGRREELGL